VPGRLGNLVQPGRTVVCPASGSADGDAGMSSVVLSCISLTTSTLLAAKEKKIKVP
jgi:hypothetical protein